MDEHAYHERVVKCKGVVGKSGCGFSWGKKQEEQVMRRFDDESLTVTEDAMRQPTVNDFVRLTQDLPALALCRGELGVVRSTWFAPNVAYEVEFHPLGLEHQTRALLLAEQVEVEEGSLFASAAEV